VNEWTLVTHNVGVGKLAQPPQQVDMAAPDMTEQTIGCCSDAGRSQY